MRVRVFGKEKLASNDIAGSLFFAFVVPLCWMYLREMVEVEERSIFVGE